MSVATLGARYKTKLAEANLIAVALKKLGAVVTVTKTVGETGAVRLIAKVTGGTSSTGR
jgi:ribosomal protein S6E (S10)